MPKVITSIKILVLDLKPDEVTIKELTLYSNSFFNWRIFVRALQFAPRCVVFSGAVPAWAKNFPDHRWLDSDQQYHFVKVHALCKYPYEKSIIDCSFLKPNVAPHSHLLDSFDSKNLQNRNGQCLVCVYNFIGKTKCKKRRSFCSSINFRAMKNRTRQTGEWSVICARPSI